MKQDYVNGDTIKKIVRYTSIVTNRNIKFAGLKFERETVYILSDDNGLRCFVGASKVSKTINALESIMRNTHRMEERVGEA